MQHVRDGMSQKVFQQGLELWRKRYPVEEASGEDEEDK